MNPHDNDDDEIEEYTFLERNKIQLCVVSVAIISLGIFTLHRNFSKLCASQSKVPMIVSVRLPALLPTPPPAPTPMLHEIKQEEKMLNQEPVDDKEVKPDNKPPEAAPITTNIAGHGPDTFGLKAGNGSGSYLGGGQRRSQFGWYAAQVQSTIGDVLRKNPHMRSANFGLQVRIWSDLTGRVTRAKLMSVSNDPSVDEAIQQSLTGIQLKVAPPVGMPMPIVMRIVAQRPR